MKNEEIKQILEENQKLKENLNVKNNQILQLLGILEDNGIYIMDQDL